MNLACTGFWIVALANGGTLYTDDLETALRDPRPSHRVVGANCRSWGTLPPILRDAPLVKAEAPPAPGPRILDVAVVGQGRQGYRICQEAREAARWSDLPCAPERP